ncbi:unnamed protein product [Caenorhabditis nigoni]
MLKKRIRSRTQIRKTVRNGPVTDRKPSGHRNGSVRILPVQGWSSYVVITAIPTSNLTNSPILQIIDFNQKVENIQYAKYEKFYFVAPGGRIKLSTHSTTLLIQDFEITKEISEYQGVGGLGTLSIVMDGSKQPSAFSTYSPYGYANDCFINITGTGTLDVYYGGITESKSNLIASYSASSSTSNLPQLLRGVVRTYILTGGIATVNINRYSYFCNHIDKNMNGFITSREYKTNLTLSYSQDSLYYYSKGLFNYTLNVQTVDLSQNKSLQLKITNNKTDVLNVVYNSSNPPMLNTVLSGVGNEMDVFYRADYDSKKDGFYIDFTATKVKESAAKSYGFIVICAILWTGLF